MRSSSCLPARDWNSTKPPYWMNEGGLGLKTSARRELKGARDFQVSSAVSGFREVRKKRKAKSFFFAASDFGQHQKFPPHSRNTSGTQGKDVPERSPSKT